VPRTVLIVEDEFLIALDLTLVLEKRGWSVLGPVASVEAALHLLDNATPAVALLDVNLTDGPVTLVAEALRARNVPFVMASAYSRPEDVAGDVLVGAPNVGKPTDENRLFAALEQSLNKPTP
jgi:DNA-binding response OmpR family regulator